MFKLYARQLFNNDRALSRNEMLESIEEIDEAETEEEAQYLQGEYALAFGAEWDIYYNKVDRED